MCVSLLWMASVEMLTLMFRQRTTLSEAVELWIERLEHVPKKQGDIIWLSRGASKLYNVPSFCLPALDPRFFCLSPQTAAAQMACPSVHSMGLPLPKAPQSAVLASALAELLPDFCAQEGPPRGGCGGPGGFHRRLYEQWHQLLKAINQSETYVLYHQYSSDDVKCVSRKCATSCIPILPLLQHLPFPLVPPPGLLSSPSLSKFALQLFRCLSFFHCASYFWEPKNGRFYVMELQFDFLPTFSQLPCALASKPCL